MREPVTTTSCMGAPLASEAAASAAMAGAPAAAAAVMALKMSTRRTSLETWLLHLVIKSSCRRLLPSDELKPAGLPLAVRLVTFRSCMCDFVPLGKERLHVGSMLAAVVKHQQQLDQ
jgi:hypothetical protein